jgi:hypothetical protein
MDLQAIYEQMIDSNPLNPAIACEAEHTHIYIGEDPFATDIGEDMYEFLSHAGVFDTSFEYDEGVKIAQELADLTGQPVTVDACDAPMGDGATYAEPETYMPRSGRA